MKLAYLGDAHDHWKGSIFTYLQETELVRKFSVDPMVTDPSSWNAASSKLYAHLLRVDVDQLVQHHRTLFEERASRRRYFADIPRTGDIFLDADTGIKTSGSAHENHLLPKELFEMMESERDRLVIVYQHSSRGLKMRARVEGVLIKLKEQKTPFFCASYESNTVALLLFCRTAERVQKVRDCFYRLVRGTDAERRVGYWNC